MDSRLEWTAAWSGQPLEVDSLWKWTVSGSGQPLEVDSLWVRTAFGIGALTKGATYAKGNCTQLMVPELDFKAILRVL